MLEDAFEVLIVEDDDTLAAGLGRALMSRELISPQHSTLSSRDINARPRMKGKKYALVILDVNLPDGDGFDFLREIKRLYDTRVIMLTANDLEMDIVAGLEAGADDYITKPFSLAVLRARINTQLRNLNKETDNESNGKIDTENREITTIIIDE